MALLDGLRRLLGPPTAPNGASVVYVGPSVREVLGQSASELFRTQPHLRTVVTFLARNISQLPLHTFQRVADNDRRRLVSGTIPELLKRPNHAQTGLELLYRTVADLKLHDIALWAIAESSEMPSGYQILPIPYSWIQSTSGGSAWVPQSIHIVRPGGQKIELKNRPGKRPEFLLFHGYDPDDPIDWASPVDALRDILAEQIQAWSYRQQVWSKGGRVGTFISRPVGAPEWSPEARRKFQRDWKDKWAGPDAPEGGGTPLFEDGMTLNSVRFNAREEEWSEVAKLSLVTVASVYHVNPTMVGILDNANYSNVREFKQMLITDTLGFDLAMIEARVNAFLVPWLTDDADVYVEFNVAEKLKGSFEEQAAILSTSVGAPWMLRDEARARMNLPQLPDGQGSQLVTPLNVLVGGQASPRDTAPPPNQLSTAPSTKTALTRESADSPLSIKSEARPEDERALEEMLKQFFKRQAASVLPRLGAKNPEWWDEDRWNAELADDLYKLALQVTSEVGGNLFEDLGSQPSEYSPEQTQEFLKAVSESRAGAINSTTLEQIERALAGELADDAVGSTPEGVFQIAESSRSGIAGVALATTLTAFAVGEAAKQFGRDGTTKTWVVNSANPRNSHAAMNGETVPVGEKFSNGADWPGDAVLGADGVAGCMCSVDITIP